MNRYDYGQRRIAYLPIFNMRTVLGNKKEALFLKDPQYQFKRDGLRHVEVVALWKREKDFLLLIFLEPAHLQNTIPTPLEASLTLLFLFFQSWRHPHPNIEKCSISPLSKPLILSLFFAYFLIKFYRDNVSRNHAPVKHPPPPRPPVETWGLLFNPRTTNHAPPAQTRGLVIRGCEYFSNPRSSNAYKSGWCGCSRGRGAPARSARPRHFRANAWQTNGAGNGTSRLSQSPFFSTRVRK